MSAASTGISTAISVVAPVFNERECLPEFHRRVAAVLDGLTRPFEIILVDDGSRDDSWARIVALSRADSRVKGVRFTRNFGQHHALSAGLDRARGEWVVLMDCDLQDRPEELPALLEKAGHEPTPALPPPPPPSPPARRSGHTSGLERRRR